jgi:hypothetical protein
MTEWVSSVLPSSSVRGGLAYGNGRFVTIGYSNTVSAFSDDGGATWTAGGALPAVRKWSDRAYGNGIFVAICGAGRGDSNTTSTSVAISSDGGVNWTAAATPFGGFWNKIVFTGTVFVVVSTSGASCLTSPNGVTWTQVSIAGGNFAVGTNGSGVVVSLSSSFSGTDSISYSSNHGASFTTVDGVLERRLWLDMAWNGNVFCATEFGGRRTATSPDGLVWTDRENALPSTQSWISVAADLVTGRLVATAQSSNVTAYSDDDGVTWTETTITASDNWYEVACGDGVFVSVATGTNGAYFAEPPAAIDFWDSLIGCVQA